VGKVTVDEFRAATVEALDLARANHTNLFLIDDSLWQGGTAVIDLYELPNLFMNLVTIAKARGHSFSLSLALPNSLTQISLKPSVSIKVGELRCSQIAKLPLTG
jgi:hypothetical protein